MLMANNYLSKVIELAKSQVGYHETGTNVTKYAADFDTKYPDFYNTKKQGVAWCDMFFDWLMVTSFGEEEALKLTCQPKKSAGAGCRFSYGYYKKKKQVGDYPVIGAQIFFSNAGTEADINHTGIVIACDDQKVITIEGNSNNQVAERCYTRSDKKIFGYGYPKYDIEIITKEEPQKASESLLLPLEEVARKVINGDYGNGTERVKKLTEEGYEPKEVQTMVNAILNKKNYDKVQNMSYKVTARSGLRLRSEDNTSSSIIITMPYGSIMRVTKVSGNWAFGKWRNFEGWASMTYLNKI